MVSHSQFRTTKYEIERCPTVFERNPKQLLCTRSRSRGAFDLRHSIQVSSVYGSYHGLRKNCEVILVVEEKKEGGLERVS